MLKGISLILLLPTAFSICKAQKFQLSSPSGNISITIENKSKLTYQVTMGAASIVMPSPLGFKFKNEADMGPDLELLIQKEQEINETWKPVIRSKHAIVRNHCRELKLHFIEKSGLRRKLDLEFRAYDDGIAFRYQLYRSVNIGNRHITKELTTFKIPGNPKAWVADYKTYVSSKESEFLPQNLSSLMTATIAGPPFLIEIDKSHYAAITEANINNYPGFYIGVDQENSKEDIELIPKLSPLPLENPDGVKVRFSDKIYTPWRVILLGSSPGKLIESEIIQNLNAPCAIKDPSWIKPGISAWDHWWSGDVKQDMPTIKKYIDLAAKQGWPYMLIDWQWYGKFDTPESDITKPAAQLNMPELLAYAKARKVRLCLWLTSGDANRNNNFEEAFALYEKWGIAGVKIDFMDRDDQEMVNWYREIIKKAAEHHLMVDFHGAYKPDGIIRTYPNMLTREGVMGEEYTKFGGRLTPEHNVTIPFTRMLAGQMDYTPGGFLNVTRSKYSPGSLPSQVRNTRCAELSKFVIYESPLTVFSDHPDHILNQPGADFLKVVPTVWDNTQVISGYPAEHIALVKQSGKKYFIGAMTNSDPRSLDITLDFLPKGNYEMTTWEDAPDANTDPTKLIKITKIVNQKSNISIKMAKSGGFVAELHPLK